MPTEPVSSHQAVQTLPVTEDMAQQTSPDTRHMTAQTAAADIGHLAVQTDKQLRAATGESSSMTTEPCAPWSDQVTRRNEDIEDMFLASGEKLELEKKRLAELESKFKSEAESRLEALSVHSDRISALERKQVQLIGYIDDKEQELLPSQSERETPIGKSGSEESLLSLKGAGKRVRKNSSSQSPEGSGRETTPPPWSAHPCSSAEVPSGMTPSRAKTPPKFRTSPIAESVTARLYKTKNGRKPEETDGSARKKPASKQKPTPNDHTTSAKSDPVRPANKSSVSPDGPKSPPHGRLVVPGLQRSFSTKLHLSSSNLASVPESSGEVTEAPEDLSLSLPELSQSLPTSQNFDMISEQPRCHSHANLSLPPHDDMDTVPCAGQPSSSETRVTAPVHPTRSVPYHISSKCSQHHDPSTRKAKPDASPLSYHVALKSLQSPSNAGRDRPPAEVGQRCDKPVSPVAKTTPARKFALQSRESSASTVHVPVQWNSSTSVPTKICKHDPKSTRSQRGDGKDQCSKSHPTGRTVPRQMSPRLGDVSPHSSSVSKQDTLLDYLASHRLPLDGDSTNADQTTKGRCNENKPETDITRTLPEVGEEHWSVARLRTVYPATHIESPDVIPRIAVPDITSSSPLKTHRSDGDQDSVRSSVKRDGSPMKKRRRSADIPVEIYIPGGVPVCKRGGHSPQEADALFFDFTDSMQGLTGHVVMETPFGTPPGEMIVTDDWTKVIRRHGQKATDQQDKTHVHHTPAMVTARMTTGGSPFSAASSKHIWPTLADDYVSILDLKAEQMKDSEMTYRQSADQCTRSADHRYTVPHQQKYFVPTDRQSNVPTDHKHTAPTNHEHSTPTGQEHTMSGDRLRHSMPSNHQHTVPTGHKHTMPTNHHHTVPVEHEHTLPTDCHHSVPTEHIAPVAQQHTVPNQCQYPVQTGGQHTIPNDHQHTIPNIDQHTVPNQCQHTVPSDGQHTVPSNGQHTVPFASQHTVSPHDQYTVPATSQQTVPTYGQHIVPSDGQGHKGAALSLLPGDTVVQGDNFTDDSLDEDIRQVVTNVTPEGQEDTPCSEPVTETKVVSCSECAQSRVCLTNAAATQQKPQQEPQQKPQHEPQQTPHQEPQQRPQHEPQQTPHQEPQQRPQHELQHTPHQEPQQSPQHEPQQATREVLQQDESQQRPQEEPKQSPQEPQQRPSEQPLDTAPVQAAVHAVHQVAPPTEQPPLPTSPLRITYQTFPQSAPQQPQQRQTDMPPFSDDSLNDNSDQPASDTVLVSSGHDQPSITVTPVGTGVTTTVVTPGELSQKHTACEHRVTSPPTRGQTATSQPAVESGSIDGPLDTEEQPSAENRQVIIIHLPPGFLHWLLHDF